MSGESPGQKQGFRSFVAHALRPKKSRQVLRKGPSTPSLREVAEQRQRQSSDEVPDMPSLAPLEAHRLKYKQAHSRIDTQTGEYQDYTSMLHAIGLQEQSDSDQSRFADREADLRPPGEPVVASLSAELWASIAEHLSPKDVASLALASRTLYVRLGTRPFRVLDEPENHQSKIDFLVQFDRFFPHHLLCIPCARYHRRTQPGKETLQPSHVLNPLFNCPNATNPLLPPPRHRLTHGRTLPFSFVQLVMRAHRFAPVYGIPADSLWRRWKRDGWSHSSRYLIASNGHLLVRVVSQCFAPPGMPLSAQRMLLYSREDYWPYFSACAHWRDGELMDVCKCALNHIPRPRNTNGLLGIEAKVKDKWAGRVYDPYALVTPCAMCQPMRRCPDCPSEYLVEVKLTEDRSDPKAGVSFKHAIVVTRWSDLGDGSTPSLSREWAACNGDLDGYDSFHVLGRRSISGTFESAFTHDTVPGQRVVSMNPSGKKLGEEGNDWY